MVCTGLPSSGVSPLIPTNCHLDYAEAFPTVEMLLQGLKKRSHGDKTPDQEAKVETWLKCLSSPIKRVRQYITLLRAVLDLQARRTVEWRDLQLAIDEMSTFQKGIEEALREGRPKQKILEKNEVTSRLVVSDKIDDLKFSLEDESILVAYHGLVECQEQDTSWTTIYSILLDDCLILAKPFRLASQSSEQSDLYKVEQLVRSFYPRFILFEVLTR